MDKQMLTESQNQVIQAIADSLSPRLKLLVVTGAGMSADSGLPTYRGVGGLYNTGETERGLTIEQLLSGSTFRQCPDSVQSLFPFLDLKLRLSLLIDLMNSQYYFLD